MKRAEFDWRPVLIAVYNADLSDSLDEGGFVKANPQPSWPSSDFEALFCELRGRIIAPPKKPARDTGCTVADVEAAVDALLAELAQAEPPCPRAAKRWEQAVAWLLEAKRLARETKSAPSVFDT